MGILFVILHCINSAAAVTFVVLSIVLFMPKYIKRERETKWKFEPYSCFLKCLVIIFCVTAVFAAFALAMNFLDGLSNFDVAGPVVGAAVVAWLVIVYPIDIGFILVARKCDVCDGYGGRMSLLGDRTIFSMSLGISGLLTIVLSLASYCIILVFNLA
jgi:hypothetical protein